MSPDKWLDQYYSGEFFTGRFDHLKDIVEKLELDSFATKIVTIAGTNGKGETSRTLAHLLDLNYKSYGLWTSPHLIKVNERFHFSGEDIKDPELINAFEELKKSSGILKTKLSYFEFLFISFLIIGKLKKIDVLILEVGLGGRLDAVNVLDADICAVTSISRDHQDILGNRYDDILKEKLGILRTNCQLYSCLELSYLRRKTRVEIQAMNISWCDLFESKQLQDTDNFSKRNKALATEIASNLLSIKVPSEQVVPNYSKRYEITVRNALFDLYPSHNTDGLRKLVQFLKDATYTNYDYVLVSFSDRSLEDLRVMTSIILNHFTRSKIYLYKYNHFKSVQDEHLKKISHDFGLEVTDDKSLFKKIDSQNKYKVLVTGSNYFLGNFITAHPSTDR